MFVSVSVCVRGCAGMGCAGVRACGWVRLWLWLSPWLWLWLWLWLWRCGCSCGCRCGCGCECCGCVQVCGYGLEVGSRGEVRVAMGLCWGWGG